MTTPERSSPATHDALDATAAAWLARRDAGLSKAEEHELAMWLAADPRHAAAWQEMEAAWLLFDRPRSEGSASEMMHELAARRNRRRWRVRAGTAVAFAAAACVASLFFVRTAVPSTSPVTVATEILSRPETRTLPDGSVIELNAGAEIAVDYSATRRGVRLVRGEAHFAVMKDGARPFVVTAGALEVRAVGTAFAVKLEPQQVDVLVTEGRVAIERPRAAPAVVPVGIEVGAGARLSVPATLAVEAALRAEPVPAAEIERLLAWRGPRLELSGTPLAEAIAVLNRENRVRILIPDAELAEMRMSGIFRADNAEGFVRLLESHYGVQVERRSAGETILRKAR